MEHHCKAGALGYQSWKLPNQRMAVLQFAIAHQVLCHKYDRAWTMQNLALLLFHLLDSILYYPWWLVTLLFSLLLFEPKVGYSVNCTCCQLAWMCSHRFQPLKSWIIWEMQRVSFQMSCVPKRCFPWQLTASVQPASNGPGFWSSTNCRPLKTWSSVSGGSGYTAKSQIRTLREPQCKSLSPTSLSNSYVFLLIFLSWRVSFFTGSKALRICF